MLLLILSSLLLSFFPPSTSSFPLSKPLVSHVKSTSFINGPALQSNFPDPGWIIADGSEIYVAFSSNNYEAGINVPVATSTDFETWALATGIDALLDAGNWTSGNVQAPDVVQLADGTFVMYYSAQLASNSSINCIGAATSQTVDAKYTPLPQPLICPEEQGGAISPSPFLDHTGDIFLLYTINGNSLSPGDPCTHYNLPGLPTPIMIQRVSSLNGTTVVGPAHELLAQDLSDGPGIGAPSMTRVPSEQAKDYWLYILFFSSGCANQPDYSLWYATSADGVLGGEGNYTRAASPLMAGCSHNGSMCSPGSASVQLDAQKILWNGNPQGTDAPRQLWAGNFSIDVKKTLVRV